MTADENIADSPAKCHCLKMKWLQSAWTPNGLGVIVLFPTIWLLNEGRISETVGLALAFGATFLLLDGGFGLRVFPRLLSLARTREEENLPETMLYSPTLGGIRLGFIVCLTLITMLGLARFGKADWLIYCIVAALIGYCVLLTVHAKIAIQRAGDYLLEQGIYPPQAAINPSPTPFTAAEVRSETSSFS